MREIPLTRGLVAIVDDEDYEALAKFKWQAIKAPNTFYATRTIQIGPRRIRRTRSFAMHREILRPPTGVLVDHKNRNGLDNRRDNLRLATPSQNLANSILHTIRPVRSSQFRGVSWKEGRGRRGLWRARISKGRIRTELGGFAREEDAARAYDAAAIREYGEFAFLNFPESAAVLVAHETLQTTRQSA